MTTGDTNSSENAGGGQAVASVAAPFVTPFSENHRQEVGSIKPSDVTIDPSVQRERREREIAKIAANFNPAALGVVAVSVRSNGLLVLIDGQQRTSAAVIVEYDEPIPAVLHYGLTKREEARLFRELNFRESVGAVALFNVGVTEGQPDCVAINDLLKRYGHDVVLGAGFSAVTTARRIVSWPNGIKDLEWAIDMVTTAWGPEVKYLDGRILEGLALLHSRHAGDMDIPAFRRKLAATQNDVAGVLGRARTSQSVRGGRLAVNVVDTLIQIHNQHVKKLENRLPEWRR